MQNIQNIFISINSFLSENISSTFITSLSVESFPIVAPIVVTTTLTMLISEVARKVFSLIGYKTSQAASLLAGTAIIVALSPTLPIGLGSGSLFVACKIYSLMSNRQVRPVARLPVSESEPKLAQPELEKDKRIAELEEEIKKATAHAKSLETDLKESQDKQPALSLEITSLKAQIAELTQQHQQKIKELEEAIKKATEHAKSLEAELKQERERQPISEPEKEIASLQKQIADLNQQHQKETKKLEEDLVKQKKLTNQINQNLQKIKEENNKLKQPLDPNLKGSAKLTPLAEMLHQKRVLEEQVSTLEAELKAEREKAIAKIETDLKEREATMAPLLAAAEKGKAALDELAGKLDELAGKNKKIGELEAALEAAVEQLAKKEPAKDESAAQQQRIKELEEQLAKARAEVAASNGDKLKDAEIGRLGEQADSDKRLLTQKERRIKELEEQIRSNKQPFAKELDDLSKENARLHQEVEALTSKCKELEQRVPK